MRANDHEETGRRGRLMKRPEVSAHSLDQGVELHPEPEGATPVTSAHQHSRLDNLGTDVQARRGGPDASRARTWLIRSAESWGSSQRASIHQVHPAPRAA